MRDDEANVLGGELSPCSHDHGGAHPAGSLRNVRCGRPPIDRGQLVCAVMTQDFLRHQRSLGNDLTTPSSPERFPGLRPGDSWCVSAKTWLASTRAGHPAPVLLDGTSERVLAVVSADLLRAHAVDVPPDPGALVP